MMSRDPVSTRLVIPDEILQIDDHSAQIVTTAAVK